MRPRRPRSTSTSATRGGCSTPCWSAGCEAAPSVAPGRPREARPTWPRPARWRWRSSTSSSGTARWATRRSGDRGARRCWRGWPGWSRPRRGRRDGLTPTLLEHQFGGPVAGPAARADGRRRDGAPAGADRPGRRRRPAGCWSSTTRAAPTGPATGSCSSPEAFGVTSFQVPLYLLAAGRALPDRVPAATYLLLRSAERLEPAEGRPDEPALARRRGRRGRARPRRDPADRQPRLRRCEFGAVCRFEGVAELGATPGGGEAAP